MDKNCSERGREREREREKRREGRERDFKPSTARYKCTDKSNMGGLHGYK
jgi:hypothetical protein